MRKRLRNLDDTSVMSALSSGKDKDSGSLTKSAARRVHTSADGDT